jgi:hypothetical protein
MILLLLLSMDFVNVMTLMLQLLQVQLCAHATQDFSKMEMGYAQLVHLVVQPV